MIDEWSKPAATTRVLVVEDDPSLNSTICYNLRREQYEPISASDGEAALAAFRTKQTETKLVVLDLMLPRVSGLHVLRSIREISNVPVLIISAKSQDQDILDGFDLGADDYVVKPFALRELLARIRALLRRSEDARQVPSIVTRDSLQIDTTGRRAWVGDTELALRPKEYGLLLTLAVDAGRVFSRKHLLETVWGKDIIVDQRTVDVHISWLRKKLRAAGLESNPIQTSHGSGYRFISGSTPAPIPILELLRQGGEEVQVSRTARFANRQ